MKFFADHPERRPGQLWVELLLALVLAWLATGADGFVAGACEARLPAVEMPAALVQTDNNDDRSCQ